MKKHILSIFSFILLLASCKKDETQVVYTAPAEVPSFTSSITSIVLDSTKAATTAVTFTWSKVSYGINADVTYTLEIDTAGGTFASPEKVVIGTDTVTAALTVVALNNIALAKNIPGNKSGSVDVRIKAEVLQNGSASDVSSIPAAYSAVRTITVTTYAPAEPSYMYVTGDFNTWSDATAVAIADTGFTGAYEGYIYVAPGSGTLFKILTEKTWNKPAYGYESATLMALGASGNLYTGSTGYYQVKANTKTRAWSATSATWGLVGDAVSDNWTTNIPMTYDPATQIWTAASVTIKSTGGFKFWASNDWIINYGVTNGKLTFNGGNLTATAGAGTYKVTLNLSNPAKYTYSIEKL